MHLLRSKKQSQAQQLSVPVVSCPASVSGKHRRSLAIELQLEDEQQPTAEKGKAAAAAHVGGPASSTAQPLSEEAFKQLPAVTVLPAVGDVLAYRLLSMDAELCPAVSEVRCGR
jgi:hypothetical protein